MLCIARNPGQLSFGKLMEVYREANQEHGREIAPGEPEERQIALSEQDFYAYLHDSFFTRPDAVYCILEENKRYVSALRLEPYMDGLLLEALETAPNQRQKGYAVQLIQAAQQMLEQQGSVRIYSHVSKKNNPSLKAHFHCGFEIIRDYAAYIDGSVNDRAYTLRYEKNISEYEKKC